MKTLRNRGEANPAFVYLFIAVFAAIVLGGVAVLVVAPALSATGAPTGGGLGNLGIGGGATAPAVGANLQGIFGDNLDGYIHFSTRNVLNTTALDYRATEFQGYTVLASGGLQPISGTFATNANSTQVAQSVKGGEVYRYYMLSTTSDSSAIEGVDGGLPKGVTIGPKGAYIEVDNRYSANVRLNIIYSKQSAVESRIFDEQQNNNEVYTTDATTGVGSWRATGKVFSSTTANTTNMTVTAGDDFSIKQWFRAIDQVGDVCNGEDGCLWFWSFDAGTWDQTDVGPDISCSGVTVQSLKFSDLSEADQQAYRKYDYVYRLKGDMGYSPRVECTISMPSIDGITDWTCPRELLVTPGSHLSVEKNTVITGTGTKNNAAHTALHTVQQYDFAVNACAQPTTT